MVELIDVNKMGSLGPKLRALGPKLRALGPKWGPLGSRPVQRCSLLKIFKFVELFDVNKTGALGPRFRGSEAKIGARLGEMQRSWGQVFLGEDAIDPKLCRASLKNYEPLCNSFRILDFFGV